MEKISFDDLTGIDEATSYLATGFKDTEIGQIVTDQRGRLYTVDIPNYAGSPERWHLTSPDALPLRYWN